MSAGSIKPGGAGRIRLDVTRLANTVEATATARGLTLMRAALQMGISPQAIPTAAHPHKPSVDDFLAMAHWCEVDPLWGFNMWGAWVPEADVSCCT